jgi:hypothetical protein
MAERPRHLFVAEGEALMTGKPKIRYTRRGWFGVLHFLTGTRDFRTGTTYPDEYGRYERKMMAGPFGTAAEAARAWGA